MMIDSGENKNDNWVKWDKYQGPRRRCFLMWTQVTSAGFEILIKWPMFFTVPHCRINIEVTFQPKLFCHLGQRYIFKDSCDRSENEKLPAGVIEVYINSHGNTKYAGSINYVIKKLALCSQKCPTFL